MGIFDKFILARAEKIKQKQKDSQREAAMRLTFELEERKIIVGQAKTQLNEFINTQAEIFSKTVTPKLVENDIAVLNRYELYDYRTNDWDGGPHTLLNILTPEERSRPVIVNITKVFLDKSLATERINQFIDDTETATLNSCLEEGLVVRIYKQYCYRKFSTATFGGRYGLYYRATFNYDGSVKPTWGLNTDSFISKRDPAFQETIDLWNMSSQIEKDSADLQIRRSNLAALTAALEKKYTN